MEENQNESPDLATQEAQINQALSDALSGNRS